MMRYFRRLADESVSFVMIVVALSILGGMFMMMLLQSCSSPSKKNEPGIQSVAKEAIMLLADNPESVKILAFSDLDSIYGNNFFSDKELNDIYDSFSKLNSAFAIIDHAQLEKNPALMAQVERGLKFSDTFEQCLRNNQSQSDEHTGYKLKVLYEQKNEYNETEKNEKYLIFDKSKQHILHSFDIPIL